MLAIAFAILVTVSAQGLFGGNNGFGSILALDALTHHGGRHHGGGYGGYGYYGGYGHDDGFGDLAALSLLGGFGNNNNNNKGIFGGNNGFSDFLALDALTHHGGGYGYGGYGHGGYGYGGHDSFGDLGYLALLGGLGNNNNAANGNNGIFGGNNRFTDYLALDTLTHHGGYGYGGHDSFGDLGYLALLAGNNGLFSTPVTAPTPPTPPTPAPAPTSAPSSIFGNNGFGSLLALDALSHGGYHDGGFGDLGYLALLGGGLNNNNNNNNLGNLIALDAISHHDDYYPYYPSVGTYSTPVSYPSVAYSTPVSYPSVGAYSTPVSYPVGSYSNPVSYPSVGSYSNPVSYPSVSAYSNPVSYPSVSYPSHAVPSVALPSVGATAPHSVSYSPVSSVSRPVGRVGSMSHSRLTSSHLH